METDRDANPRTRSEMILSSMNSRSRIHILHTLNSKGSLTLVRLASLAGFTPKDAGKFEFHMKKLSASALVELDSKEYSITNMGKKALNFAKDLDSQ